MRPTRLDRLFADATTLPGIGPKLGKVLAEFTGDKLIDLLFHLPSNLIDRQYRPSLRLQRPMMNKIDLNELRLNYLISYRRQFFSFHQ